LMAVTTVHAHADRVRSYELLAGILDLSLGVGSERTSTPQ
jgi:hypothetical protein